VLMLLLEDILMKKKKGILLLFNHLFHVISHYSLLLGLEYSRIVSSRFDSCIIILWFGLISIYHESLHLVSLRFVSLVSILNVLKVVFQYNSRKYAGGRATACNVPYVYIQSKQVPFRSASPPLPLSLSP